MKSNNAQSFELLVTPQGWRLSVAEAIAIVQFVKIDDWPLRHNSIWINLSSRESVNLSHLLS